MPKKSSSKRWIKRSDSSDWVSLGGKSRRYEYIGSVKSHKGQTISRRDFITLVQGQESPEAKAKKNLEILQKSIGIRGKDVLSRYINFKVSEGDMSYVNKRGKPLPAKAARSREYKQLLQDLKSKDNSADGAKAKALVKLGLRQPEWLFDVGESPK